MAITTTNVRLPIYHPRDRLSHLSEALLLTILSLLPTRAAACTSLLSHRFRRLWEACPSLELIYRKFPPGRYDFSLSEKDAESFTALANRLVLDRSPSHAGLLSLRLQISERLSFDRDFVASFLAKICSINLRNLSIECSIYRHILTALPSIFTMRTLESLYLTTIAPVYPFIEEDYVLPSAARLTRLRKLGIKHYDVWDGQFNKLLSELVSLEELELGVTTTNKLTISSQTTKKLKLVLFDSSLRFRTLRLSLPKLETFHIENRGAFELPYFEGGVLMIRKAVVNLDSIRLEDGASVDRLLEYLSHVEELSLRIRENEHEMDPFHILWDQDEDEDEDEDLPNFPNLKRLDVWMCFHEYNFKAILSMLHFCPVLESVDLIHEAPKFTGWSSHRTRRDWKSKLP